jgi:hypothetical protein
MYYKVARQIYKELAVKHELSIDTIEQICRTPLEYFDWLTKNKASKEEINFPTLRISGFGVLYVTEGRKYHYKKAANGKNNIMLQSGSIQSSDKQET